MNMNKWLILTTTLILAGSPLNAEIWPNTEQDCLAANIYHEARGEPLVGQYLVAYVTQNRVNSTKYPNTFCEVVKQRRQFSWFHPTIPKYPTDRHAWEVAKSITAKFILKQPISAVDMTEGAIFYHASYIEPWWASQKTFIVEVSGHKFYR